MNFRLVHSRRWWATHVFDNKDPRSPYRFQYEVRVRSLSELLHFIIYSLIVMGQHVNLSTFKILYYVNSHSFISERIFRDQKWALKTIFRKKMRKTCRGFFKSNNFITMPDLYIFKRLMFVSTHREYLILVKFDFSSNSI